jgi:hypothetical protein
MFWSLVVFPVTLPKAIGVVDTMLRKTADFLKDRRRIDGMKDPVLRTVVLRFPVLAERGSPDVTKELQEMLQGHPAIATGQRLLDTGAIKHCRVCQKFYLSQLVDVGACHQEGNSNQPWGIRKPEGHIAHNGGDDDGRRKQ